MNVKIYSPSRNVMQSGRGRVGGWVLEYELETARGPETLMGWTASGDTLNQVRLKFATAEDAIAFALGKGWAYTVLPVQDRIVKPRNYVDNFKYIPPETETRS
ncbi:MAG: oxidoreductase [Micavibrio aeruginosavorus]|uniref:Oxidoreductase n=1 Tax=Micavibrio aeruginosavorus TaxID=349221 RepID=A0A2W5HPM2_9BACT|nr:MAG: oxidoreductase [Micavibrio aeruginosavorus]